MRTIEWVVKATTFCNLRCDYCYEWDGLDNRDRISIEQWGRLFRQIRTYHLRQQSKYPGHVQTNVVLHGGEPSVLPPEYLRSVLELGCDLADEVPFRMLVQTNLYKVTPTFLSLLREFGVGVSVPMDVVPGVRRSLIGGETEQRVLDNMQRLWSARIAFGVITVLAGHTAEHVERIHDFWAGRFVNFRMLPLFSGPPSRPSGRFELPRAEIVRALCRLFDHWMERGCRVSIAPLDEWRSNVIRKLLGMHSVKYDRRDGERTFVVSPAGDVMHANEHGAGLDYWNAFEQPVDEMLASARYQSSVDRTEGETARICARCEYFGACSGLPAHDGEPSEHERCALAYDVHRHIEEYFRASGMDEAGLRTVLRAGNLPTPVEMCRMSTGAPLRGVA